MKTTSVNMSEENYGNLDVIAKSLDCTFAGKPSWRVMLTKIAKGELSVISAQKKIGLVQQTVLDSRQLSWVEPKSPGCEEVVFPPKNPYVRQVELSENVVDTSEFDTPVPQRRPIAPVIAPQVAPVGIILDKSTASKEQKMNAILSAIGGSIKKASDLPQ